MGVRRREGEWKVNEWGVAWVLGGGVGVSCGEG